MEEKSIQTLEEFGYKQELKRELGFWSVLLYGMAMLFPIAAFTGFGPISSASHGHMALAYILAAIPMAFTAWSYGQMSGEFPITGSSYSYISRVLKPYVGFASGWALLLDYGLFPILNYICITLYVQALLPSWNYWAIYIGSVVLVTIINLMGIKQLARINNVLTIFGFLVVFYFIFRAIGVLGTGVGNGFSSLALYNPETFNLRTVLMGASVACYSFIGFDTMTNLSEEVREPKKLMPRATLAVCLSMTLLFTFVAYLAQSVFPDFTKYIQVETAINQVAVIIGGQTMVTLICLAMVSCGIAFAVDAQAGVSRLLYGMGRDKVIPKIFTYLHPTTKVPVFASIIMAVFCIAMGWISLVSLIPMINFGALLAYSLVNLSVIIHFWVKGKERGTGGFMKYLIMPGLGFIFCLVLFFSLAVNAKIVGFGWLAIGIIYMAVLTNFFRKPIEMHM
jgi:putrescine importer